MDIGSHSTPTACPGQPTLCIWPSSCKGLHTTCAPPARRLLAHPDPGVRARTCNLVGNMCRYSGYFYAQLAAQGLLPPLIERCRDEDRSTRKFACFAIGNAGFHSAALYESLRPAVRALVALLADPEDKTRANAAGALGNLVSGAGRGRQVWQLPVVM